MKALYTFSVEKKGTISRSRKRTRWLFFGQKSANFNFFFKNLLKFNKTHRNTCLVQISVHLEHFFCHFMAILRSILGLFSLYKKYGKSPFFAKPLLTFAFISQERLIFAYSMLYTKLKRKNSSTQWTKNLIGLNRIG